MNQGWDQSGISQRSIGQKRIFSSAFEVHEALDETTSPEQRDKIREQARRDGIFLDA